MTVSQMIAWIMNAKSIDKKKKTEECRRMSMQINLTRIGRRDVQSGQRIPTREPGRGCISV